MFKKNTLSTGFRIIVAPMQGTNTVTILVMCATGSDYETKPENGISHFLEHMFFKGTKNRPSADGIRRELDQMGSISNAFTAHETTGYFIKAGTPYLERSIEILADIYRNSLLAPPEIEKEKQVVIEEMHMRRDDPATRIWDLWDTYLYGDQPAGWDIAGKEETVRSLSQEDLVRYFEHQYVAENTAVIVAGNIDEAKVTELVTSLFSDIRHSEPRTHVDVHEEQNEARLHLEKKQTDQTHLIIGFRGYPVFRPERYAADLLATVLGGSWSSRMFSKIREELGLAYTVYAASENYSNRGYLLTYAGVAHENVEKTVEAVLDEYRRIREDPVPADELLRTKDFIKGRMLMSLETSNAVASFVGSEEMLTGIPLTIDEVFAKLDLVTASEVQAVASELFRPNRLNIAALGTDPDRARLEELLFRFR